MDKVQRKYPNSDTNTIVAKLENYIITLNCCNL
jgi:hypothetical protein